MSSVQEAMTHELIARFSILIQMQQSQVLDELENSVSKEQK